MKRLLAKLPRSSRGSREASASSSAAALPADILEVSMTDAVVLPDFALVSSATCFSGASSGDFISLRRHPEQRKSARLEGSPFQFRKSLRFFDRLRMTTTGFH